MLHLAQRLDVGGEPRQPVGRRLIGLDQGAGHLAIDDNHASHAIFCGVEQSFGGCDRLAGQGQKVTEKGRLLLGHGTIIARWSSCVRPKSCGRRISPWLIGMPP